METTALGLDKGTALADPSSQTYNIPGPPVWTGENVALDRLVEGFKGPKERKIRLT
jgi:hypothetical protein